MSRISRACPRVGIYFSHYECFGHTSRVMAVGEVFKKRFPFGNLFFIQAGVQQPNAKIDQLGRVYSLPGASLDRRHFREPIHGAGIHAVERSKVCGDIVRREHPDLFITEFFPFGREECRHELIPSLVKASVQGAAIWAAAGYPLLTGRDYVWRQKLLKLYQRIIIFSPPLEKEFIADFFPRADQRREYLDFFNKNAKKIVFGGYLLPQQNVVRDNEDKNALKIPVSKGVCRVAVLRGGGAYYPKVIAQAIRASDLLGKEYYLTVIAGPSTTLHEWDFFGMLVGKKRVNNLALFSSVNDYEGLIEQSDVCVSVASYHTSVMLLKHRKKAVVVPFEGYGSMSHYEQPARAAMLKEKFGAMVLPYHKLTAETLAKAIIDKSKNQQNIPDMPKKWFRGAEVLEKELIRLFPR